MKKVQSLFYYFQDDLFPPKFLNLQMRAHHIIFPVYLSYVKILQRFCV